MQNDEEKKNGGPVIPLYKKCPKCGTEYLITEEKCSKCGTELGDDDASSAYKGIGLKALIFVAIIAVISIFYIKQKNGASEKPYVPPVSVAENNGGDKTQTEQQKSEEDESEKQPTAEELSRQADKKYDAKEYSDALKLYLEAYEKGYRNDENRIGYMYQYAQGVAQEDYAEAVKWYRKAADQKNADAQVNLGYMYEKGQGVAQDYAEAVKWYRKAADQGNEYALNNLGNMYYDGNGVSQDYKKAVEYYLQSQEKGYNGNETRIGYMYENDMTPKSWTNFWRNIKWKRRNAIAESSLLSSKYLL